MIFNGDCREVLPTLPRARMILTDPPYNIGFKYNSHNDMMPESEYVEMLRGLRRFCDILVVIQYPEESMRFVSTALGTPDEVICWAYNSNINRRWRMVNIYGGKPDYSRVKQPYKNPTDKRVRALMDAGSGGTPIYDWWTDIQLVKNVSREKTIHPCPIPEALAERIILLLTNPGDIVVDPFAGCGTVPFVAEKLGRIGHGIEKDETYFIAALNRCRSKAALGGGDAGRKEKS